MSRIATLTMNPSIDIATEAPVVEHTHKTRCGFPSYNAGGGGVNVARAITKLGGNAQAFFVCGGHTGEWMRTLLEEEQVRFQTVSIAGTIRESFTVTETKTSHQFRFNMPGPELSDQEWQTVLKILETLDGRYEYWVLSGSLPAGVPDDFYQRVVQRLKSTSQVFVDTSGEGLKKALNECPYLIKPNRREMEQLAGQTLASDNDLIEAARALITQGKVSVVAISMGERGMLRVEQDCAELIPAPKTPFVSAVGAGDSAVAGLVFGLSKGLSLAEAFRYGVAAGSAAVMTPGTALCDQGDTERLFADILKLAPLPAPAGC